MEQHRKTTIDAKTRNRKIYPMSKIRILPDHLANQIAAGEVVERPASVIKELVENSLDAGADQIEVEIEGGGVKLMRVIDNGCGMDEDDLLMSLERHGTSKISEQDDLEAIATLGFRGEALPSVGSVAKLSLTSRTKESALGCQVIFDYGKLLKVHETGCHIGTTIEVRRLFGNTPARRKFLRTTRTEQGHIEDVIKNYALGRPDIRFLLRMDGREVLHLDTSMNTRQRLAKIMRYNGEFFPVTNQMNKGQELERRLEGYLVPPETVTTGPSRLRLFVNGRAVRDRMMIHAVTEGLRGFLLKGKNPSGLIHLTINPSEIDVNVHPAKQEIRFRNANEVHTFLVQGVEQTMRMHQQKLQSRIFHNQQEETYKQDIIEKTPLTSPPMRPSPHNEFPPPPPTGAAKKFPSSPKVATPAIKQPLFQDVQETVASSCKNSEQQVPATAEPAPFFTTTQQPQTTHNLRIIGVFHDLYILCQGSEGLVVIDQHAAHERLLYEKLRKQYLGGKVASQTLMFAETVELSLFQTELLEKNLTELERLGFSIRDFGGNTFVISAVPALARTSAARELLVSLLEQFGLEESNRSKKGSDLLDDILASMACKAAVKANTSLSHPEIEALLNDMAAAELFSHCPHGRPVVRIFCEDEVKKWFYRT